LIRNLRNRVASDQLSDQPDHALVGVIKVPELSTSPLRSIVRRLTGALIALVVAVAIVYLNRGGYHDSSGGEMSLLDCIYYATVSLSTTGYGDITPVSASARLVDIVVMIPLRVLFLLVLVGTTVEVLTERSRQAFRIQKWRWKVRNHVIVVGFGTKGRSAVNTLLDDEDAEPSDVVVVDTDQDALDAASAQGLVTVHGNATRADVLRVAGVQRARAVVVATNRDDAAVLVTLTARELAPKAHIIVSVREGENVHLLKQSGASQVVVSSDTAGRLLGMATSSPQVVNMVEDLLTPTSGLTIAERDIDESEEGGSPRHLADTVLGLVRDGVMYRIDSPEADAIEPGDRLLYVRKTAPAGEPQR